MTRLFASVWTRFLAHENRDEDAASGPVWKEVAQCYLAHAEDTYYKLSGRYRNVSDSDIEDAVQDAFLKYFKERSRGKLIQLPEAWLFVVASNALNDRLGKDRPLVHVDPDDELLTEIQDDAVMVDEAVRRTLQERRYAAAIAHPNAVLTPFELRCFRSRLANKTYREIAAAEGRSIQGVADAIRRARVRIRRHVLGQK